MRDHGTRLRSIVTQGDHGIDAHSSSCWNNAGDERSEQEDGGDDAQDSRVSHAALRPLVYGVVEADAEANAQKKANARGPSDGSECKCEHAKARRAKGNADTNFAGALFDRVSDDGEKADCGQAEKTEKRIEMKRS